MVARGSVQLDVRHLSPSDRQAICGAFGRLSLQTRYMRYGIPVRDPAPVLGWIEHLDGARNCAVGAFVSLTGELIGGARYATAPDGTYAEVAAVIVDAWQGQRIGPWLLTELIKHAQGAGAAPLRASVLPDNRRAQRVLRRFGGWRLRSRQDGLLEYELIAFLPAGDSPRAAFSFSSRVSPSSRREPPPR